MSFKNLPKTTVLGLALVALSLAPASAQSEAGQTSIEVYVGAYSTDVQFADEEITYGLRFDHNITRRFNLQGQVGFLPTDAAFDTSVFTGDFDFDTWFFEVSAGVNLRPGKRVAPLLFGGIGYAFTEVEGTLDDGVNPPLVFDDDLDSLTAHVGFATKFYATEKFFIRTGTRARWFEARENNALDIDDVDTEFTLAFGLSW